MYIYPDIQDVTVEQYESVRPPGLPKHQQQVIWGIVWRWIYTEIIIYGLQRTNLLPQQPTQILGTPAKPHPRTPAVPSGSDTVTHRSLAVSESP